MMNADVDCPNCGLGNYYPTDPTGPYYPYCDQRCQAADEERRRIRALHRDLFIWSLHVHLDNWRMRISGWRHTAAAGLRGKR